MVYSQLSLKQLLMLLTMSSVIQHDSLCTSSDTWRMESGHESHPMVHTVRVLYHQICAVGMSTSVYVYTAWYAKCRGAANLSDTS